MAAPGAAAGASGAAGAKGPQLPSLAEASTAVNGSMESLSTERPGAPPTVFARSVGPMTVNGLRHSTLTLTTTALGGGVLSISYVMRTAGLGLGMAMIVIAAWLAYNSTKVLMRMAGETGQHTYAGLFSHCAGRYAGPVLDAMLFFYGSGACVGYLVFLGDLTPPLLDLVMPGAPAWIRGREFVIIVAAIIITPLSVQRDISCLRYMAPVSIVSLMYMAITVAVKMPSLYQEHAGESKYGQVRWVVPGVHVCEAFALCVFAFNCHLNVVPVAGHLVRPTRARISKVSERVNLLQMCFYSLIGVTGYLSFLADTPQDLVKAYAQDDPAVVVGRAMLTATMLVAIPINLNPTIRSALQIRRVLGSGEALLQEGQAEGGAEDEATSSASPAADADVVGSRLRVPLTCVCVLVQVLLAINVPGVADILGLLGATVATAMMMAIPAYCMSVTMPMTPKHRLQQVMLYVFSLVSVASVPVKVLTMLGVME
mmetsp:Transcript_50947/g.154270  ORF Transcript_50947/g.154270 Transcript_50947/m.154270 type:complete len:484 (-) Transcript_50947:119-1570(-)